jgi:hypothetical protein
MRRVLPLISMFLLFPALSYGQWSGILSSSRAIDWRNAGLPATYPDGETTPNPWTPPVRTACSTLSPGATVAQINTALSSCGAGHAVLLNAGTYNLSGTINLPSNVTLRGSGASGTTITGAGISFGSNGWGGASLLTGTIAKGTSSVTIANGQLVPSAGRLAALAQCDTGLHSNTAGFTHYSGGDWIDHCTGAITDPGTVWVCSGNAACDRNGSRGYNNAHTLAQVFWIPSGGISGNTVNFPTSVIEAPIWSTAQSASIMWLNTAGTVGAGIEGLTWVGEITITGCYGCWMKGIRMINSGNIQLTQFDSHVLIANNYIATSGGGNVQISLGYENETADADSDLLFLNNIVVGYFMEEDGGNSGMVLAYNYFRTAGLSWAENGDFAHNPGGLMYMLREGNQNGIGWDDDTWTTHNFSTFMRNWFSGYDAVTGGTAPGIDIGGFARFDNVIGNVVGSPQSTGSYGGVLRVNASGGGCGGACDTTGLTQNSLMRWGNYVYCSGDGAHCQVSGGAFDNNEVPTVAGSLASWPLAQPYANTIPGNHNLPPSFFLSVDRATNMGVHANGGTGLNWWKTCSSWTNFPTSCASYSTPPMPPIGPEVTGGQNINGHAYNIPAYIAFNNLPTDPAYPSAIGGMRQFDERVYNSDSGGGTSSPPDPPTNLTGVVH